MSVSIQGSTEHLDDQPFADKETAPSFTEEVLPLTDEKALYTLLKDRVETGSNSVMILAVCDTTGVLVSPKYLDAMVELRHQCPRQHHQSDSGSNSSACTLMCQRGASVLIFQKA